MIVYVPNKKVSNDHVTHWWPSLIIQYWLRENILTFYEKLKYLANRVYLVGYVKHVKDKNEWPGTFKVRKIML